MKKSIIFAVVVATTLIFCSLVDAQTKVHMGDWQASGKIESLTELGLKETTNTGTPAANFGVIRAKPDGKLYYKNSAGTEVNLTLGTTDGTGTANEITYWVDSDTLGALAVATYPSLAELAHGKGVTSAIQTQFGLKQGTLTNSAGLAAALSDETGSGLAVFNTSPSLVTPILGVASATSLTISGLVSTGGTVTTDGSSTVITYNGSGSFTPPAGVASASVLVVAGGGGGGMSIGGGGGAGGYRYVASQSVVAGTSYTITVGAGGAGASTTSVRGSNGVASSFASEIVTVGGGGGTGQSVSGNGANGGSGGGGARNNNPGGTGTSGEGNAGGSGSNAANAYGAGGGGGAGAVGANGSSTVGGDGGVGLSSSISGVATFYAGGGGGGRNTGTLGLGGNGGGGNAADAAGVNGTANTGGGGGGNSNGAVAGGNGGSGIVIVRYTTPAAAIQIPSLAITGTAGTGYIELGHATDTTLARVSAGVVSIEGNNIITANIASSPTVAGVVELATASEINTGTDTTRTMPIDQFEASNYGKRTVSVTINNATVLTSGDGKAYFRLPDELAGWSITQVRAARTAGNDNINFDLYNVTQGTDTLSTAVWIDGFETDSNSAGTSTAINTAEDDATLYDRYRVDCNVAGTDTTWAEVQVTFERVP